MWCIYCVYITFLQGLEHHPKSNTLILLEVNVRRLMLKRRKTKGYQQAHLSSSQVLLLSESFKKKKNLVFRAFWISGFQMSDDDPRGYNE